MNVKSLVAPGIVLIASLLLSTSYCRASILYVDGSIPASGAGTSWVTAKKTVQEAVSAAAPYDQVWVKAGTYPLASTISLNKAISLYGGFAGTEAALSQRNLKSNTTTLDGQNARQCVSITSDYVTVDGFSVTKGYATGATQSTYGSGIYINVYSGSSGLYTGTYTTVRNCKIFSNTNVSAIYMYVFTGTISNCIIYNNTALYDGAGIYDDRSQAVIINCSIIANRATNGSGGGIYFLNSTGTKIYNSILWSNLAGSSGPNLYLSSATISVLYSDIQGGYTGIGNKNIAPGFVSAGTYNYHLAPGAACCVDQGSNSATSLYNVLTDFEGDPRISGTYADIGADEYFVANAPTVSTAAVSGITTTTATSGGSVTADGGAAVTARGVCWGVTANPTTTGSCTSDGTGTGSFVSAITGLAPATGYHVRAYATNTVGTDYGSDVAFSTNAPLSLMLQGTGSGIVHSDPPDINCASGTCNQSYPYAAIISLVPASVGHSLFRGWSGDCTSTGGNCTLVMDQGRTVLATFDINPAEAVWVDPGDIYYDSLGSAYQAAAMGGCQIKACRVDFPGDIVFGMGKAIILKGGYDSDYQTISGYTGVVGTVTIASGVLTFENIAVK